MHLWGPRPITDNPHDMLWHYANGRMPDWINGDHGDIAWIKRPHRGVQWLNKVTLPKKPQHLKYITQSKFQVRFDTDFPAVLNACADLSRQGKTWITPELHRGYLKLHKMGFAHSFEAWDGNQLVAGAFGVQMGSIISIDSVFHHVSNAGMAVYGQTLLRLRDRGFTLVDVNYVSAAFARFGEEWMPQWQYEQHLRACMMEKRSVVEGGPTPILPASITRWLSTARLLEKVASKFGPIYDEPTAITAGKSEDDIETQNTNPHPQTKPATIHAA